MMTGFKSEILLTRTDCCHPASANKVWRRILLTNFDVEEDR